MNSYLFIFGDGSMLTFDGYDDDDVNAMIDGYIDVVDITNPSDPKQMYANDDGSPIFRSIDKRYKKH